MSVALEPITDLGATHAEHLRGGGDIAAGALHCQAHQVQFDFCQGLVEGPLTSGDESLQPLQQRIARYPVGDGRWSR